MGEHFDKLPEPVREHLRLLVEPAGLKDVAGGEELLAEGWLVKQRAFEHHTSSRGMIGAESYSKDESAGALMMTYSGSIVSIGPVTDGTRDVAYASIGIRRDVPQMLVTQDTMLAGDVTVGGVVQFEESPVQKTSPVYAIMVFDASLPPAKENAALAELTEALTERFVDINTETLGG
ncbi:MAG: hypothetical protein ACLFPV_05425 [Spirochaetaceae bacterium]